MKIYILYNYTNGAFGGANQFLKALRQEFFRIGVGIDCINDADTIIYNNFFFRATDYYSTLYALKRTNPNLLFLHRLDGLQRIIRNDEGSRLYDEATKDWAQLAADGVIFQNAVSLQSHSQEMMPIACPYEIIGNAPDPMFFYPAKVALPPGPPWRLVYTSWSSNLRKGFPSLTLLDQALDFSKYHFTFVGNIPEGYSFKNIKVIAAQPSAELGCLLRQQHVFIGLSHNEPCSNAVIEAMHCGLPALLRNSGGNSEFMNYGGVALFDNDIEILQKIDAICAHYTTFCNTLSPPDISSIAKKYTQFIDFFRTSEKKKIAPWKYYFFRKKFAAAIPFSNKTILKELLGLS